MKKLLIVLFLLTTFLAGCTPAQESTSGIQRMDTAGYKELMGNNAGRVVVINIFASWCPPCEIETPDFVTMYASPGRSFELIGLSIDDNAAELAAFMKKHGVNYPVYIIDKRLQRRLMADKVPTTIIYKPNGEIFDMHFGLLTRHELRRIVFNAGK